MPRATTKTRTAKPTPTKKESILDPAIVATWHRVYFHFQQAERCLREEEFVVGKRVAVWQDIGPIKAGEAIPFPKFYTGVIERIWGNNPDDPLVTIKYDANPYAISITFGIKNNYKVVPLKLKF